MLYHSTWNCFAWILATAACGCLFAAGLPAPVLHGGLEPGSTTIRGSLSRPAAGTTPTLKVFVNGREASADKVLLELTRGEFEIHLNTPLRGGDLVEVQHLAAPDLSSDKSPARRVPGVPQILGKLEDTAEKVKVKAVTGARTVVVVVTDSADKLRVQAAQAAVPTECALDATKCDVEVKLQAALSEGERVRVQEVEGPLSEPSKVAAKAGEPFKATINSIEAYYGGTAVKIYFEKLPEKVEKANVWLKTCLETKSRPFTDDERKAQSIEVTLDRGIFCPESEPVKVKVSTQTKGDTRIGESSADGQILVPRLSLDPPISEGDGVVTGKATGAPKVRIRVYSGWQLETPSIGDIAAALKKKEEEAAKLEKQVKAEQDKQGLRIKTLEAASRRTAGQIAQLKRQSDSLAPVGSPLYVAGTATDRAITDQCREGELVQETDEAAVTDGKFSITLDSRLNAAECVVAIAVFGKEPPITAEVAMSTNGGKDALVASRAETVRSVIVDWGRLRGYFSLGGAVSHHRDQFSQVDTFIGFTTDSRITGKLIDKSDPNLPLSLRRFRWQLNVFTDARVSVRLANGTTGNPASANANTTVPPITDPRLVNRADQPGYLLGAIHIPMSVKGMDWRHLGQQYSFFFAPIFRFGGQTQSEPTVVYRHLKVKPASDPRTFNIYRDDTRSGVLPMWGYGLRTGIYKYDLLTSGKRRQQSQERAQQRQVANDPIGYADITLGKSSAFRSYRYAYVVNGKRSEAGSYQFVSDSKLEEIEISSSLKQRLQIETRLKIPKLPALVGADMDIRTNAADFEPNQLRFVIAFRVDAQKALGRIFGDDLTKRK